MKKTIFIILILTTQTIYADYHYASHEGSNEYPYTSWATAADAIQDAVDAASPGDTVYIGSGAYYERIVISTDSLAIIGMGWDSTLVWHNCGQQATISAVANTISWIYYEGLHVQERSGYWGMRGGTFNNLHVNQCKFSNPDDPEIGNGLLTAAAPDFVLVENCIFELIDDGFTDILFSYHTTVRNCLFLNIGSNPIMISGPQKIVIDNNIFAHGGYYQSMFGGGDSLIITNNLIYDRRKAVGLNSEYYTYAVNNTFALNHSSHWSRVFNNSGLYRVIMNNSISGAREITVVENDTYLRFAYNNIWDIENEIVVGPSGQLDTAGGNLRVNPMYMGNYNYHLQAFSPLIDAGNPDIFDLDETRSDIGVYGGPGGEIYTYIDIPPTIPDSLIGEHLSDSIIIDWRYNTEADFSHYYLYRDTISGFEPNMFNLIAEPDTSYFSDTDIFPDQSLYYKIAALDNQNNISDYSEELAVIPTGIWHEAGVETPEFTSITSNYPNPFNSQTTIEYFVANLGPIPAQINIDLYDILGRKVRTLLDDRKEVGTHVINWDGRDNSNNECPSGLYFARITQWNVDYLNRYKKIMLMK